MELAERIVGRVAELTGEAEVLRKQLDDAERELDRLEIGGQVITQLISGARTEKRSP
jgi:phage shock protein A